MLAFESLLHIETVDFQGNLLQSYVIQSLKNTYSFLGDRLGLDELYLLDEHVLKLK